MRTRSISLISSLGWPAWLATVVAFALLCASIAYWSEQLLAPRAPLAPAALATDSGAASNLRPAAALFGVAAEAGPATVEASNLTVLGVLSAGARGSAVLSVDGKPAKAYGVGASLTPSQSLLEVRADSVVVGTNGRRSELPAPPRPTLAILSSGPNRSDAGQPAAPVQAPAPAPAAAAPPQGIMQAPPSVANPAAASSQD